MITAVIQREFRKLLTVIGLGYLGEVVADTADFVLVTDVSDNQTVKRVPISSLGGGGGSQSALLSVSY